MDFEIVPFKSVGAIEFGMEREKVRSLFEQSPSENSHPMVEVPSDEWGQFGLRVDYSPAGRCEAILLVKPGSDPTFMKRRLLEEPHRDLCTWIREIDETATFPDNDEESLASYKYGFMLGAPRADEPENSRVAMAVFVWQSGYWDE